MKQLLFITILDDRLFFETCNIGILPEHKIESSFDGTENWPALFSSITRLTSADARTSGKILKS